MTDGSPQTGPRRRPSGTRATARACDIVKQLPVKPNCEHKCGCPVRRGYAFRVRDWDNVVGGSWSLASGASESALTFAEVSNQSIFKLGQDSCLMLAPQQASSTFEPQIFQNVLTQETD